MTKDLHETESPARRNFIKAGMVAGVGALLTPLIVKTAQAATEAAPAAAAAAAAAGEKPKLKIGDVLRVAREKLYPICRVCPECDGVACAGEVPGMGGIGSGQAFKNNYNALNKIDLVMRTFHDVKKPDLAITLFGQKLSMPVTSAVTGGVSYNMGKKMTEEEYVFSILGGCQDAGTIGWVADPPKALEPVRSHQGRDAIAGAVAAVAALIRTQHAIIGEVYDLGAGPGTAHGRVACIAHHWDQRGDELADVVWHLRYDDEYELTDRWRIARRALTINAVETRSVRRVRRHDPA